MNFYFDGRSRANKLNLARDHRPSRDALLDEANKRKQKREEEHRQCTAATTLQQTARRWLARLAALRACVAVLQGLPRALRSLQQQPPHYTDANHTRDGAPVAAARLLQHACWCYRFVARHRRVLPSDLQLLARETSADTAALAAAEPERESVPTTTTTTKTSTTATTNKATPSITTTAAAAAAAAVYPSARVRRQQDRLVQQLGLALQTDVHAALTTARDLWPHLSEDVVVFLVESALATAAKAAADASTRTGCVNEEEAGESEGKETNNNNNNNKNDYDDPSSTLGLPHDVLRMLAEEEKEERPATTTTTTTTAATIPSRDKALRPSLAFRLTIVCLQFATQPRREGSNQHHHHNNNNNQNSGSVRSLRLAVAALTAAFAALVPPATWRALQQQQQHQQPAVGHEKVAHAEQWEAACWAAATAPEDEEQDAYLTLTADLFTVLFSLPTDASTATATSGKEGEAREDLLGAVVAAVSRRLERTTAGKKYKPTTTVSSSNTNSSEGKADTLSEKAAMAALGRLTRLLPCFLRRCGQRVLRPWLRALATLTQQVCMSETFLQHLLYNAYQTAATTTSTTTTTTTTSATTANTGDMTGDTPLSSAGRYRYLVSYLFSSEGGLLLLDELVEEAEMTGGLRGSQSTTAAPAVINVDEEEEEALREQPQEAASSSPLELFCGVIAWPLFYFSVGDGGQRRPDTAAIVLRLVHRPSLLRQLWQLYCKGCEGLQAVLPPGPVLHQLLVDATAVGEAVRLPFWPSVPPALAEAMSTKEYRVHRNAFWDPSPALATLFFTLLSVYVDSTDFADSVMHRREIFSSPEVCWAFVLALKEIVHRSHLFGVVPKTNSEAVAHVAFVLLCKLHYINEASPFVTAASLWVSTSDQVAMRTLGAITPELWAALTDEREEQDRAVREAAASGAVEELSTSSGSSTPAPPHHANNRDSTAAAGAAAPMPGDDILFSRSCAWEAEKRMALLLMRAPFTVPFAERAALLTMFLLHDQPQRVPGMGDRLVVHRGTVFNDAFDKFHEHPNSIEMFSVRFADRSGQLEEGYGQGVYRELMVSLCKEGFAAEHGFFKVTEEGFVYPNPFSLEATGDELHLRKIHFLGAMVGRALRDGILQDVPFALHFRNALLGRRNSINNLKSYDRELYQQLRSLLLLSEGELAEMELTFTYVSNAMGITREYELVPNGAHCRVNTRTRLHYMYLVADYKLNREGAQQTEAFRGGLERVIQSSYLRLFDSVELLNLFGGDHNGAIDIADWRKYTVYHDAKDSTSVPVQLFWEVVESLSNAQRSKLLQFATSMQRPPLLGFRFLSPPFMIHVVWTVGEDRLPTASTCFSTIKLPAYKDYGNARAKIIAAIEETNTFQLS